MLSKRLNPDLDLELLLSLPPKTLSLLMVYLYLDMDMGNQLAPFRIVGLDMLLLALLLMLYRLMHLDH